MTGRWEYLVGDAREVLRTLPEASVQVVVTSPPYYGLRDYGVPPIPWGGDPECAHEWDGPERLPTKLGVEGNTDPKNPHAHMTRSRAGRYCKRCGAWCGCLGLEPTVDLYVEHLVEIFRDVRRVLRDDGIAWLNLGDSYASGAGSCYNPGGGAGSMGKKKKAAGAHPLHRGNISELRKSGLKPKDLVGIPWMTAFAMRADGWWLRRDVIWSKPSPMPESAMDRPTSSHEYIFMLTKSARYFYDKEAILENPKPWNKGKMAAPKFGPLRVHQGARDQNKKTYPIVKGANRRSVWTIKTKKAKEAHFATYPMEIPDLCIKASTSEHGACAICGAPWHRILIQVNEKAENVDREQFKRAQETEGRLSLRRPPTGDNVGVYETIRWEPTCVCLGHVEKTITDDEPATVYIPIVPLEEHFMRPCVVLDPFAGSGTTVLSARRLRRSAIGVDINPKYKAYADEKAMLKIPDITSYEDKTPTLLDFTENEEEEK